MKTGGKRRGAEEGACLTGEGGREAPLRLAANPEAVRGKETDESGAIKLQTYLLYGSKKEKKKPINKVIKNHVSQSPPGPSPMRDAVRPPAPTPRPPRLLPGVQIFLSGLYLYLLRF